MEYIAKKTVLQILSDKAFCDRDGNMVVYVKDIADATYENDYLTHGISEKQLAREKEDAIKKAKKYLHRNLEITTDNIVNKKYFCEVRHGKWRRIGEDRRGRGGVYACSCCHICFPHLCDYCPNCGAKMDGGEKE